MSNKVRIGMVGCGGMAGAHRDGYKALWDKGYREFEILACCDVDPQHAESLARPLENSRAPAPGIRPCRGDAPEGVVPGCGGHLDAALHHHSVAVPCLRAGKHVTIEKPLGVTMRACWQIIEAARESGTLLQVAENYGGALTRGPLVGPSSRARSANPGCSSGSMWASIWALGDGETTRRPPGADGPWTGGCISRISCVTI